MAKHPLWSDEYWLLLMQLYLKKPVGAKALYSRSLVSLALELHIRPQFLHQQMLRLRQLDTPRMEQLWAKYSKSPKRLSQNIERLRKMKGFGQANTFYEGVEINESWEQDFKPIFDSGDSPDKELTPVHLIMILDLYFRLTPNTMVAATPEIRELARHTGLTADKVVEIMDIYQTLDPYLNRTELLMSPLVDPCQEIWQRFGNDNPEKLSALAAQLKEYFR
jgi:hypothetical protein